MVSVIIDGVLKGALTKADVKDALTEQGYTTTRAENLDNLDAAVSTRLTLDDLQTELDNRGVTSARMAKLDATTGSGSTTVSTTEVDLVELAPTNPAIAYIFVDVSAMASGDAFTFKVYYKADASNYRLDDSKSLTDAQTNPCLYIGPYAIDSSHSVKVSAVKTAGTDRTFPWSYIMFYV